MDTLILTKSNDWEYEEKITTSIQKYTEQGILTIKDGYLGQEFPIIFNFCKLRKSELHNYLNKFEKKYRELYIKYRVEKTSIQNTEIRKDLSSFLCDDIMRNIMNFYKEYDKDEIKCYYTNLSFTKIKHLGGIKRDLIIYRKNNDFPKESYKDAYSDTDTDNDKETDSYNDF